MNDDARNQTHSDAPADTPAGAPVGTPAAAVDALWAQLTTEQKRYVVARLEHPTVTAAAQAAGVGRTTVYQWPPVVEACVAAIQADTLQSAMDLLRSGLMKAVYVKMQGLDSSSEKTKQDVASELIDRFLGKARQELDLNHSGQVDSIVQVYLPDNNRD